MIIPEANQISIETPKTEFERFLSDAENRRIFFSGRFGIGKTFFLHHFFEQHKDKYDTYHIFPVRYQISSNENIIELFKYDILVELLKKYPDVFSKSDAKGQVGWFKLFAAFAKDRDLFRDFLQAAVTSGGDMLSLHPDPLFQAFGKLGRPISDLLELDKEFQAFKKEYLAGDKGVIEKYIANIEQDVDPAATDYVSSFLYKKISEQKSGRRSVLILDDFDRIDPEHIFRILNVLSVHIGDEDPNRFGFDHIIIVGDVSNIKNIFHHKYGLDTDFIGYFDKFFTIRPFELGTKHIAERIAELVKKVKCDEPNLATAIGDSGYIKYLLADVLNRSLSINRLNLRQLYRPLAHPFPELRQGVYGEDPFKDNFHHIFDIGVQMLVAIFGGDANAFIQQLKLLRAGIKDDEEKQRMPYAAYIGAMMRDLVPKGNLSAGKTVQWEKYTFDVPDDGSARNFSINGSPAHVARFFYDALIEYVRVGKHLKDNRWDYDR